MSAQRTPTSRSFIGPGTTPSTDQKGHQRGGIEPLLQKHIVSGELEATGHEPYSPSGAASRPSPHQYMVSAENGVHSPQRLADRRHSAKEQFIAIQNWEGVVETVKSDRFVANVKEANISGSANEEMEIMREDLSPGDLELLQQGAIFYLTIGYWMRGGQREKATRIVFRRMPSWSRADLERATARANEMFDALRETN